MYMRIGVMKDSKTKVEESTRLTYTGVVPFLLSYILRYVSFVEVASVYRVTLFLVNREKDKTYE